MAAAWLHSLPPSHAAITFGYTPASYSYSEDSSNFVNISIISGDPGALAVTARYTLVDTGSATRTSSHGFCVITIY